MEKVKNQDFHPLVSIVIPVYNGSNYMREAIDSALAQTYDNLEIIVVNDGSTDNTDEIAKSYGDKIRYFSKENGGTTTALNLGIENMKGSYFSWLSHDDMYYPNKIARQVEELSKLENKDTIMMSDLDEINDKYEKTSQTRYIDHINQHPPRLKSNIHPVIYNQTHGCVLLIPKACFDAVGLFDEKQLVAQDFEFFYRAFLKFPHKLISEVLVTARDSSGRQGRRSKARGNEEYSALFISIINNLTDEDIELLAADKLTFYSDMRYFFQYAGYTIAFDFIEKKMLKNLQISSYDLIGNKFNGYDLHLNLREKGIESKQLVLSKHSNDVSTYSYDFNSKDATKNLLQQDIFLNSDLIHLHLVHNIIDLNYLPIITQLKPVILSMHDPFFLGGHCVHHFDCKKWQTHCGDCPYLREEFVLDRDISALNFELKKQAVQNSQISIIVASQWMKNKVEQSPIWKGKKVYFLPFGINHNLFKPSDTKLAKRKLGIRENSTVIMLRADNGSFKGLDIIKKALSGLTKSNSITLITVGQKGLLKEFKEKFNIVEHDWISDDKLLVSLYQACDIFLMPSRQETFGMMAIEAMSCGKMVLAVESDGSALPEVINSPTCGLAVKEADFTKELQRLIDNPKEIIERGKQSLDYARSNYSKDIFVNETIRIYTEVMSEHHLDKSSEFVLQQLKKNAVSDGIAVAAEPVAAVVESSTNRDQVSRNTLLKIKLKTLARKVLRTLSPTFRMLQGNKNRMNTLLDRTAHLEALNVSMEKNVSDISQLIEKRVSGISELIEKENQSDAILKEISNISTALIDIRKDYDLNALDKNINILGDKVYISDDHTSETKTYHCNIEDFFKEMESFILKTDTLVDIGCGIRPQTFFTPKVHVCVEPFKQYRDVVKPFFPNKSHFIFLKEGAVDALRVMDDNSVDSVFMIDIIEHLEKEEGLLLLKEADRVARKQIVVFTPLGFYPMHFHETDQKDAWGLDGNDVQEHKSGWLPEDFGESWDFHICEDCHEAFLPEEKATGKRYSALMAIKTKNFHGFSIKDGTPEFVKQVYEERIVK